MSSIRRDATASHRTIKKETHASALHKKTKPMPARFNMVTKHLQDVQIGRQKQAVEGLGVRRIRDPAVNSKNERI